MRLRLSTSHRNSLIRRSKSLKHKRKVFENEIKEIICHSLAQNDNNKELVEKNVSLMSEIATLRKEKLDLFERFMFKQNPNQLVIKNDLIVLLESLKSDKKEMNEMFQKTNEFFSKMINKISDKIEEVIGFEDKRIECNPNHFNESDIGSGKKRVTSHEILQMRRMSRQSHQQNDCIEDKDLRLSDVPEVTEVVDRSEYAYVESHFETPNRKRESRADSVTDYEMTPHFSKSHLRTPSIYNFECNSFNGLRHEMYSRSEETSLTLDESLRPDLNLSHSLNSTLTEENGIISSTPVCQMRDVIPRPSKRISSINRPYSPRFGRPSLIDIQNVMENNKKSRKHFLSTNCESKTNEKTNERIENQSNDTNYGNSTKRRRKKCDSKSLDSDISESSANSSLSLRSSRRNRKQISYKEPSLMGKLRRPTD